MSAPSSAPLLRAQNITKRFHQVVANDAVSFDVLPGEIHCLLGENGAGKSTLAECLYGFLRPDAGRIYFEDQPVDVRSPAEAIELGIGMVHQHFVLVNNLSVLENVIVGTDSAGFVLDLRQAEKKLSELCDKYKLDLDLNAQIWQLPVGQQQWVEILKALYLDAKLLILDEPTAVLTPQESQVLFATLRQMTDEGISVILITHKFNEVMQSDRVTILRKGKRVDTVETQSTSKEQLTSMMVGREISLTVDKPDAEFGDAVLEVDGLSARDDRAQPALRDVSFAVRQGEILGIAGVAGNGQKELFETIIGVRPATAGSIRLGGEDVTNSDPQTMLARGVGHIPDDRFAAGLIGEFTIAENLVLGSQREQRFATRSFLNFDTIATFGKQSIADFEIVAPSHQTVVDTLSGGNAQKVIVAREFEQSTKCILANQPSRGLDVGVIQYVHHRLLEKRSAGFGILLASEELEELFNLADRIAVMFKGEIRSIVPVGETTVEEIGLLMAGHEAGRQEQVH
jgi:simple sugar transport system ATP-binding protein